MTTTLTARVLRSLIPDYAHFLTEQDRDQLQRWADTYKVPDIREWAQARIESLERRAAELDQGIEKF